MGRDFLPHTEAGLVVWLQNFVTKLNAYTAALGVTPAQVTQFQSDLTDASTALNNVQATRTNLQSLVQAKDAVLEKVTKRIRDAAVIFKRNPGYTDAIGEDLGIVRAAEQRTRNVRSNEAKPTFVATVLADRVRLDWVKGEWDGITVQCRRGNETQYTSLDKDTISPYEDARPNLVKDTPETRFYRMRYLIGDDEIGVWSDEVKAVCLM